MPNKDFEPKILGFLCNWCCYTAADSAGVARYQYPPHVRVIRIMCTGRLDPWFVLDAFARGADGVFVGGCHLGECHYVDGNYQAVGVGALIWKILAVAGVAQDRFALEWASAAEGPRFVELITNFTNRITELGPLGTAEQTERDTLSHKLGAARRILRQMKLRTAFAKLSLKMKKEGFPHPDIIVKTVQDKLEEIIKKEFVKA